ncbi:hypothetical protein CEUSTIGMA_g6681.t1 [Chlamydomonas eustigma]|uniref:Uncharacterized protein n=1 Tax=Chlamydomonas eustigma TaxID=1157962 RepID=A0A250X830_9CHLO|nr:hypothetical protein CEUSTIGMA_g6681.t1 [Chlamydomonas eustigma]|eukprot:GAX79241.1 hypothetical protein CEUSTIGMA_g6681.t1 [Chlamydomonas eustigma]
MSITFDYLNSFDNAKTANVVLHLTSTAHSEPLPQAPLRTLHLHSSFLEKSPYFKAAISFLEENESMPGSEEEALPLPAKRARIHMRMTKVFEIDEMIEPGELEPAVVILRYLYKPVIPPELMSGKAWKTMFQMYRLANKFGMDSCSAAIALYLGSLKVINFEMEEQMELLKCWFTLPAGLRDIKELAPFRPQWEAAMLGIFGNVPKMLQRSPESTALLKAFIAMPYDFIQHWLTLDKLQAMSENCVFLALNEWVEENYSTDKDTPHKLMSEHQLLCLGKLVRFAHLTPSYLHTVLPQIPWFAECKSLMSRYQYKLVLKEMAHDAWLKGRERPRSPFQLTVLSDRLPTGSDGISLSVSAEEIVNAFGEDCSVKGMASNNMVYDNGFYFQMFWRIVRDNEGKCVELGVLPSFRTSKGSQLPRILPYVCSRISFSFDKVKSLLGPPQPKKKIKKMQFSVARALKTAASSQLEDQALYFGGPAGPGSLFFKFTESKFKDLVRKIMENDLLWDGKIVCQAEISSS